MAALIGFLFDPHTLQKELNVIWCSILDDLYVKEKIVDPLIHHISNGMQLEQDLIRIVEKGMEINKSEVKPTQSEPFLLTVPHPRKVPIPTYMIKKSTQVLFVDADDPNSEKSIRNSKDACSNGEIETKTQTRSIKKA
jgi:hypothetical protein